MIEIEKLTQEEFDEFVAQHLKGFKKALERKTKSVLPILAVLHALPPSERKDGVKRGIVHMALAVDFPENGKERHDMFRGFGRKLYNEKISIMAIAFASEAWSKGMSPSEWHRHHNRSVSSYADKGEIVMVSAMAVEGWTKYYSANVTRDEDNNIVPGEFSDPFKDGKIECGLLKRVYEGYREAIISDDDMMEKMPRLAQNLKKEGFITDEEIRKTNKIVEILKKRGSNLS